MCLKCVWFSSRLTVGGSVGVRVGKHGPLGFWNHGSLSRLPAGTVTVWKPDDADSLSCVWPFFLLNASLSPLYPDVSHSAVPGGPLGSSLTGKLSCGFQGGFKC